jgi:hypothetical protein
MPTKHGLDREKRSLVASLSSDPLSASHSGCRAILRKCAAAAIPQSSSSSRNLIFCSKIKSNQIHWCNLLLETSCACSRRLLLYRSKVASGGFEILRETNRSSSIQVKFSTTYQCPEKDTI